MEDTVVGIGKRIREARIAQNLTQEELAKVIGVTKGAIANYETETSHPKEEILYRLFPALRVDANYLFQDVASFALSAEDLLSPVERDLLRRYRLLPAYTQETISYMIDRALQAPSSATAQAENQEGEKVLPLSSLRAQRAAAESKADTSSTQPEPLHLYPYLNFAASAGAVSYIDDIPTEQINVPYCEKADFIIGVSGASMEPDYLDGDMLYVQKTDSLRRGEIGIFSKGGSLLVKELGKDCLISRNPAFSNIYPDGDPILIVGRVLGKVQQNA